MRQNIGSKKKARKQAYLERKSKRTAKAIAQAIDKEMFEVALGKGDFAAAARLM